MGGTAAAAGLTHVVIQNGTNSAAIDKSGQLLTSEAAPNQYVFAISGYADDSSANTRCKLAYSVPAGKAFVLRSVTFTQYPAIESVPGDTTDLALYSDKNCITFTGLWESGNFNPSTTTVPVDPGYIVNAGQKLYVAATNTSGYASVSGYLVPSAAAPIAARMALRKLNGPVTRSPRPAK